jgi:hypothetical protein
MIMLKAATGLYFMHPWTKVTLLVIYIVLDFNIAAGYHTEFYICPKEGVLVQHAPINSAPYYKTVQ